MRFILNMINRRKVWSTLRDYPVYSPPFRDSEKVPSKKEIRANYDYFLEQKAARLGHLATYLTRFSIELHLAPETLPALDRWLYRYGGHLLPRGGVASDFVLLSDPEIAAIETSEGGEPAVDATGLRVDRREARYNPLLRFVRAGLYERLLRAEQSLPPGVHLLLVEGYRPPAVQLQQFTAYVDVLRERNPDWTAERLRREASRFISPPEVAPRRPARSRRARSPPRSCRG